MEREPPGAEAFRNEFFQRQRLLQGKDLGRRGGRWGGSVSFLGLPQPSAPNRVAKTAELYFSHFRLKSEIEVAQDSTLSKAAPCFPPCFRGRWQSLGFLGWSACHRPHLLRRSLRVCALTGHPWVSVPISLFLEDPSHIGIRAPLCSSVTFS